MRFVSGTWGATLLELIVALVVLGVITSVVGLAFTIVSGENGEIDVAAAIQDARNEALQTGNTVLATVTVDGIPHPVTALPDGRVLADSTLRIDALTGAVEQR